MQKIVMPKVFDEWVAMEVTGELYWDIEVLNDVLVNNLPLGSDETQEKLAEWVGVSYENDDFMPRYEKCIKALMYGYTVEDTPEDSRNKQTNQQDNKEGNKVVDKTVNEAYKPIMPKVFLDFAVLVGLGQNTKSVRDNALTELSEMYAGGFSIYNELMSYMNNQNDPMKFYAKCVYAVANGYVVEPERKYYVKVNGTHLFFSIVRDGVYSKLATVNCELEDLRNFKNQSKYQFADRDIELHGLTSYQKIDVIDSDSI